jgi:hypothetical protein
MRHLHYFRALIEVTAENYEKIWKSEGGGAAKPGYEEVVVEAIPYGSGKSVKAIALRAAAHVRLRKDASPSARYMNIILQGAKELGLVPEYINRLQSVRVQRVSPLLRIVAQYYLFFMSLLFKLKMRPVLTMLSKMLWLCYAPQEAPVLLRMLSEISMLLVLLPGSALGLCVMVCYKIFGVPLPVMFRNLTKASVNSTSTSTSTQH